MDSNSSRLQTLTSWGAVMHSFTRSLRQSWICTTISWPPARMTNSCPSCRVSTRMGHLLPSVEVIDLQILEVNKLPGPRGDVSPVSGRATVRRHESARALAAYPPLIAGRSATTAAPEVMGWCFHDVHSVDVRSSVTLIVHVLRLQLRRYGNAILLERPFYERNPVMKY